MSGRCRSPRWRDLSAERAGDLRSQGRLGEAECVAHGSRLTDASTYHEGGTEARGDDEQWRNQSIARTSS